MKLKHSPRLLLLVGSGLLMVVDTLLAWQSVEVGGDTYSRNAWHGFWGIILGLLSLAFLANASVQAGIVEFRLRLPHRYFSVLLAAAIVVFAIAKNIHDDHSAWASYIGIALAALVAASAWLAWKEPQSPADAAREAGAEAAHRAPPPADLPAASAGEEPPADAPAKPTSS
ncbi:MAG TPA: hypothetical protein VE995_07980 [Gaiellaceae bacterium]|nr:hypothetical protein [Gaiellaceae bacterium]